MGLLDGIFNTEQGRMGLGLLAAGSARGDGAGFGQRLSEAVGSVDQWKQQQAQAKRMKMQEDYQAFQMQQAMAQAKAQEAAAQEGARIQGILPSLVTRASQGAPALNVDSLLPAEFRAGTPTQAAVPASEGGFDMQAALRQRVPLKTIEELQKLTAGPEYSPEVRYDQNGKAFMTSKSGGMKFLDGVSARDKLVETDLGGTKGFRTEYSANLLASLPKTMTFADRNAAANLDLSRQKFTFDKAGGAEGSKPPTGYRWKMDRSGLEAIPGGPADIKAGEAGVKAEAKKLAGISSAENVRTTIGEAKDLVGMNTAGVGSWASKLPATDARDLSAKLETIKGNLGFDRLQQMRDQSPTGGALGAVAVQELTALQSTVASLDQGQSPSQLRAALGKIDKHYENWQAVMRGENPYDKPKPNQGALGSGSFKIISVE